MLLRAKQKLETANTNRDGTGTVVEIGTVTADATWLDRVRYQSLGDNAVCVGRLFVNSGQSVGRPENNYPLKETTLAVKTGTSQTAAIAPDEDTLGVLLQPGDKIYACVSIDLTGSAGYMVAVVIGAHRSDFESA